MDICGCVFGAGVCHQWQGGGAIGVHACVTKCALVVYGLHLGPCCVGRLEPRDCYHRLVGEFDLVVYLHLRPVLDLHALFPCRRHDLCVCFDTCARACVCLQKNRAKK